MANEPSRDRVAPRRPHRGSPRPPPASSRWWVPALASSRADRRRTRFEARAGTARPGPRADSPPSIRSGRRTLPPPPVPAAPTMSGSAAAIHCAPDKTCGVLTKFWFQRCSRSRTVASAAPCQTTSSTTSGQMTSVQYRARAHASSGRVTMPCSAIGDASDTMPTPRFGAHEH